jgi:cytochrome c biogenesis protein
MNLTKMTQNSGPLRYLWRFFTSVRLTLVLISIIILLGVVSIFLVQSPQGISYGSAGYYAWLENAVRPDFGIWTDTLSFFGLFDVFHSPIFLGNGILLVINILCCSIRRLPALKILLTLSLPEKSADGFEKAPVVLCTKSSTTNTVLSATNVLLRHNYRVKTKEHDETVFISADKYAFSRLGTLVSHLSLILLIIGFLVGSFSGFRDDAFIVAEGYAREVGHNTGLTLGLVAFTANFWPDGTPQEYRSDIVLFKNGQPVKNAAVRINHPLSYAGVRIYQSFYGPVAEIHIRNIDDNQSVSNAVALTGIMNAEPYQRPFGRLDLPVTGLTAFLVAPAINIYDPILKKGQIGIEIYEDGAAVPADWLILNIGEEKEVQGMEFSYIKEASFSGFIIKHDPGAWLVWMAFGLFLAGISMVLFLPYYFVQAMVKPDKDEVCIYLRSSGRRAFDTNPELTRLGKEMMALVAARPKNTASDGKADD